MPEDYFEYPLGDARVIETVEQAKLAYVPNVPDRLGEALRIQADFRRFPGAREIAWAFLHPEYGRFIIQERLESRSGIENYIRHSAAQECGCRTTSGGGTACVYGEREQITLPGGITALVFAGDRNTSVEWVEPLRVLDEEAIRERRENIPDPGLLVSVVGPSETFTRDVAVAVAERI